MSKIKIILWKQFKDGLKNKAILMAFFTLPLLYTAQSFQMDKNEISFFVPSFLTLHLVMNPILCTATIIAEEKEKSTLQALITAGIKPTQYLFGTGLFVLIIALLSSTIYLFTYHLNILKIFCFYIIVLIGASCSILIGAIVGLNVSKQSSVGPISTVLSMFLGVTTMFSSYNEVFKSIMSFFYTQQIANLFKTNNFFSSGTLIIILNFSTLFIIFLISYKRNRFIE